MTITPMRVAYQCCDKLQVYSDTDERAVILRHQDVIEVLKVPWDKVEIERRNVTRYGKSRTESSIAEICEAWASEAHNQYERRNGGVGWKQE